MPRPNFSVLNDEWLVEGDVFSTPKLNLEQEEQFLIFAQTIKDGSLSADLTPESGGTGLGGYDKKDLSLVFRYNGQERAYVAGIGGYGAKYFIARMSPGDWQLLATSGNSGSPPLWRDVRSALSSPAAKLPFMKMVFRMYR